MADRTSIRVLVVDDEESIREVLDDFLSMEGYQVTTAECGEDGVAAMQAQFYHVMLIDLKMPGISGLEVLERAAELSPRSVAIMMTGFGTVETAIAAMKRGAYDYVLKPFKVQDVIRIIDRGIEKQRLQAENIQLREALELYRVSERMAQTLSLDRVFDILLETARDELRPDGLGIWLADGDGGFVDERQWTRGDLKPAELSALHDLDIAALHDRVQSGESLVCHRSDTPCLVDCAGELVEALVCVPFRHKNETMGYLVGVGFDASRRFREGKRKMLSVVCGRATAAIENARLYGDLQHRFKQTIQAFANLLEDKDPYTRGHSERVSRYARLIAEGMGLGDEAVDTIADAALLHDIGKLGIRFEDLNKAEPLTESEYEMFKSHTTRGKWMLEPIEFLHDLIPGVYHHHERWDGKGYPLGLRGEETPLMARVLAVADTYDAMTSHRAYRRALPHDVAVREIEAFAGSQFDPDIVEVFVREIARDQQAQNSKAQRWKRLAQGDSLEETSSVVELLKSG